MSNKIVLLTLIVIITSNFKLIDMHTDNKKRKRKQESIQMLYTKFGN